MHSVKKAARREAWYPSEETGGTAYNPFGRSRQGQQKKLRDVENGGARELELEHSLTEAVDPKPTESARRDEHRFDGPAKTGTFPGPGAGYGMPPGIEKSEDIAPSEGASKYSERTFTNGDNKIVLDGVVDFLVEPDGGPIRRGTHQSKLMPWKKVDDSNADTKRELRQIPPMDQFKALFGLWVMVFIPFVPAGFAVNYSKQSAATIFVVNFFAIIPSSAALGLAVEQLGMYFGDKLEGVLSMTFSNAVQLISSILLLKTRQIAVLQASLLGGILQNLLLMTGLAFLLGGLRCQEQYFNARMAQTIGMFLLLAVLSLTIPTVSRLWGNTTPAGVLAQSRGTAVIIMVSYILWLVFQLKTNRSLFELPDERPKLPKPPPELPRGKNSGEASRALACMGAGTGAVYSGGPINGKNLVHEEEEEEEEPQLSPLVATATIIIATALLALNTQFATDSIQALMAEHGLTNSFMGIVILPLLSNDPATIKVAMLDKMDLGLTLTLERAMQTALMVVPLVMLAAWAMHIHDMTLDFDAFSVAALFASILIVTYVVQEGRSNWLVGALLLKVFIIISLASFYID